MFKKYLLAPLLVIATFLGIGGINTANASMVSDKQTMIEMGKQFIRNSAGPSWEDFDWADANMVSPAKDNPYRYGGVRNRFFGAFVTAANTLGSLVYNAANFNTREERNKNFNFTYANFTHYNPKNAISIMNYITEGLELGATPNSKAYYALKRKIWFVKVNGQWKIKNYYTLLTKIENSGTKHRWVEATPQNISAYGDFADKTGTTFPF